MQLCLRTRAMFAKDQWLADRTDKKSSLDTGQRRDTIGEWEKSCTHGKSHVWLLMRQTRLYYRIALHRPRVNLYRSPSGAAGPAHGPDHRLNLAAIWVRGVHRTEPRLWKFLTPANFHSPSSVTCLRFSTTPQLRKSRQENRVAVRASRTTG